MKRKFKLAVAVVMIITAAMLCACQKESPAVEAPEMATEEPQEAESAQEKSVTPEVEEAAEPEVQEAIEEATGVVMDEKKESALWVMDSLLMCMYENDYAYEPTNPEFFWSALVYTIGNYGYLREGSGMVESDGVEGVAKVYERVVQEYATALFEDYDDLPEIPSDMTMVYVNPDDSEQYCFLMGDRGISASRITEWRENGDGSYQAEIEFYALDDDSVIAVGKYTLVDNPYLDGITDPIFYYTVRDAQIVKK